MEGFINSDSSDSEEAYQMEEMALPEEHGDNQDPDEHVGKNLDARMGSMLPPPAIRQEMNPRGQAVSSNTGPKGVKADYEEAKFEMATIRMRELMIRERTLQNMANGKSNIVIEQLEPPKKGTRAENSSSESDSDLKSEDEEFTKYKLERIRAIQASLPRFGTHERVSKAEFADAVHNTHELAFLVVHLYQNHMPACVALNLSLEALAPQFPHVRFCRIRSTEAVKNYSDVGLPTIMIYRAGALLHSFVKVTEQLGHHFTDLMVAQFLQDHGVLTVPDGQASDAQRKADKPRPKVVKGGHSTKALDSDSDWGLSD